MGEAKRRGTVEQRAAESIARAEADARCAERMKAANERQRIATLAAMPPQVRQRVLQRERVSNQRLAVFLALGAAFAYRRNYP